MDKLRILVGGFIGLLPAGGVTWDYLQYPLGLKMLGHEVYYLEDTRLYPIYQKSGNDWNDSSASISHLKTVMKHFGFQNRWAYRDEATGNCYGLTLTALKEICRTADVFINISCSTFMREEYQDIPVRILIDSDPMFTQIQYVSGFGFGAAPSKMRELVQQHNYHFTFGENIGATDCQIPACDVTWQPTRQPVCLAYWPESPLPNLNSTGFTTIMNWTAGKKLIYHEEEWGQKDEEFAKIIKLPQMLPELKFSLGIGQTGGDQTFPHEIIRTNNWTILEPDAVAGNWLGYQKFLQNSFGEFSVAKQTYVKARTGWFSCRSACYLASGRPVVVQDTGWSKIIPAGKGALAFTDTQTAAEALRQVVKDAVQQAKWARELATAFFDSNKVLAHLLAQVY